MGPDDPVEHAVVQFRGEHSQRDGIDGPIKEVEIGVEAAADVILEVGIPFGSLALSTDDTVQFYIEFLKQDQSLDRVPQEGAIETPVPSPEFENMMWQA